MQDTNKNNGSSEMKTDELEAVIQTPFNPRVDKLLSYISKFESSIEQLNEIGLEPITPSRAKRLLLNNLSMDRDLFTIVLHCKTNDSMSFAETANTSSFMALH